MKNIWSTCILVIFLQSSFGQTIYKSNLVVLDLARVFPKGKEVPLSKFLEKIEYVPLQTTPLSVIGRTAHYEVTDEYIIVRNYDTQNQILLFDRKTGKFIREIGKAGRGPSEYIRFSFIPYNPRKRVLYAVNTLRQLVEYDISGNFLETIRVPDFAVSDKVIQLSKHDMSFDIMVDDNVFVGYFINISGTEENTLALFTKDEVLRVFPNYQALKAMSHGIMGLMYGNNNIVYRYADQVFFLELFSDTLFQVTRNELIPRYFFKMGNYNVTWETNATMDHAKLNDYFYMQDINENNNYIFIKILFRSKSYQAFIDKKTDEVSFCKMNRSGISGFKDDLSGLMDVSIKDVTQNNEMIYVIRPLELMKWFKENPEKATEARKRLPWVREIDEFSNPVVAIGECNK